MKRSSFFLFLFAVIVPCLLAFPVSISNSNYKYYCTGNCQKDAQVSTESGYVLMGGGPDVDNAFVWMISKAKGGDFVVIRTDDDDLYDTYIYDLGPLNSVATIVILNREGAFEPFVNQTLYNAEALFLAGGDQWTYYANWKDTPVQVAFEYLDTVKHIPIGGTSAGEEVQGEFVYTAQFASVESSSALNYPYSNQLTFGTDYMSHRYLASVICDAHFYQRDRMGRLIAFMARLMEDVWAPNAVMGIGVDEGTAVLIDSNGLASITAWEHNSSAYFLTSTAPPQTCQPNDPITFTGITTFRASGNASDVFNFNTWQGNNAVGTFYQLSAKQGDLSSTQKGGGIY